MSSPNPPPTTENQSSDDELKRRALRSQVEALHAEMEIASYGLNEHTGRSKRKVSRKEMKRRTIKRKTLEKEDVKDLAVHRTQNTTKRLRGSKAAFDDEVIKGSLIFGGNKIDNPNGAIEEDVNEESADENDIEDAEGDGDGDDFQMDGEEGRYELYKDRFHDLEPVDDGEEEDDNASGEEDEDVVENSNKKKKSSGKSSLPSALVHAKKIEAAKKQFPNKKIARTMYRLGNFKSHRMAEKHGEALGRHARGMNRSAVSKLKEVATAAPIAPQVYSSLGLVYESILSDEMKNSEQTREQEKNVRGSNEPTIDSNCDDKDADGNAVFIKEAKAVNSCIELAEKTFGSYHVAALLCKLDYTLWLRAGDAAMKIAELHTRCLSLPAVLDQNDKENIDGTDDNDTDDTGGNNGESKKEKRQFSTPEEYMLYHKEQKIQWLEEAKNDYLTADNINPPGISVPSKLAHAHIQLGNLSEALTILTDLKNSSLKYQTQESDNGKAKPRSELEKSYAVWLLYADLMLTIGYECSKWNRGDQTNENYMFRRWLRKYSNTFDWRERRLYSLCLALEAAAGTKCCQKIVTWMHDRAVDRHDNNDTYDFDQQAHKVKPVAKDGEKKDISPNNEILENCCAPTASKKDGLETFVDGKGSLEELSSRFDVDRKNLISLHRREVDEFDKSTVEMNLLPESDLGQKRAKERENMITRHKITVVNLAGQYQKDKRTMEEAKRSKDKNEQKSLQPLNISASCSSVCDIASQLMKQCLGMGLYSLGGLTAEAVSLYFKERATRCHERIREMKAFDKRQITASANILQLSKEVYDNVSQESRSIFIFLLIALIVSVI